MIHISHKSIRSDEIISNDIDITAEIIDYSGSDLESVIVYWKYSSEDGPFSQFEMEFLSNDTYTASFPDINLNQEIQYFIEATNWQKTANHPIIGWHTFIIESNFGDINGDNQINIQDVILVINYILSDTYHQQADLNLDGYLNVLDIIDLVNLILEN